MGKECGMLEVLKGHMEKKEEEKKQKGDEFDLSLELSIGGRYGKKSEDSKERERVCYEENVKGENNNNFDIPRSDFSCESMDLQRRKEIQALRRQEARKRREEKLKKSRGGGLSGLGFLEDKLSLEAQKFQTRVQDREVRERDVFSEELCRKKDKNGSTNEVGKELNLSLFTENKILTHQIQKNYFYPNVHYPPNSGNGMIAYSYGVPSWEKNIPVSCRSNGAHSSMDFDSEHSNLGKSKIVSNGSFEPSSSAVSDYQSTSHKGGSSSDTGSHSSPFSSRQHYNIPSSDQLESNDSSSQTEAKVGSSFCNNPRSSWNELITQKEKSSKSKSKSNAAHNNNNWSPPLSDHCPNEKPPRPSNLNNINGASSVMQTMPCVSATGNGPNGKTINGFLYKYTKTEVRIMCVCHGSSFSPAEFVEHAGAVEISNPLRHITMVPFSGF